jgi:hypothetical protein
MKVLTALCLWFALPAQGAAPTAAETASFESWYRPAHPDAGPATLEVVKSGRQRTLTASVDGPARRAGTLCRLERSSFAYDARARHWFPRGEPQHFAWIERGALCAVPARRVEVDPALPPAALASLLGEHGVLLLRSRLLMAGNTACAPMRSHRLKLVAVHAHKDAGLFALNFVSDRATRATITVRKGRTGFDPWGVACQR